MADTRVGRRYALALFRTAKQGDVVRSVEDDLNGIAGLIEKDESFRTFLFSPYVGREEKIGIVERVFSDRITAITMTALRLLVSKRREDEIIVVRDEFVQLRREAEGVLHVLVTSAEALENDQRQQIEMKLARKLGRTIEADYAIDAHLIGGVRVEYDNFVLDGSVRGQLRRLRDRLTRDVLKQN